MLLDDALTLIERDRSWWSIYCICLMANLQFWVASDSMAIVFMQVLQRLKNKHQCVKLLTLLQWQVLYSESLSFKAILSIKGIWNHYELKILHVKGAISYSLVLIYRQERGYRASSGVTMQVFICGRCLFLNFYNNTESLLRYSIISFDELDH